MHRFLQLIIGYDCVIALPLQHDRPPIRLPRIPESMLIGMDALADRLYRSTRRGLVLLLPLEVGSGNWLAPWIPRQQLRADGTVAVVAPAEAEQAAPTVCVGGSFQLSVKEDHPLALVPQFDGVHIIAWTNPPRFHFCLRVSGALHATTKDRMTFDDWQLALAQQGDRLVIR